MEKYSLLIMIIIPHTDHEKSCFVLQLIIEAQKQDLPSIKHMLETHYQHSEFIQHFINENYRPSLYNQELINNLKIMMEKCEAVYADFYPPNTRLNSHIKTKLNELRTSMIHVCENTLCLN